MGEVASSNLVVPTIYFALFFQPLGSGFLCKFRTRHGVGEDVCGPGMHHADLVEQAEQVLGICHSVRPTNVSSYLMGPKSGCEVKASDVLLTVMA